MEAPLMVAEIVPDRKARLLLLSSHASPPSSQASFQKPTANFTDSSMSFELMATVLPSFSTSLPPHDHMKAYQKRSEEHTSELQSLAYLVCRLLLEKKKA